ncbi:uncharacterized protein [Atheta coriaria]|uniref:uncharacterized protein n=1 Tax=Dalotia coriaria TaxID=877792 RepID=UPI0031F44AFF
MASVQYLFSFTKTFQEELITAQTHLQEVTAFRILNVIIIQKTWRGYYAYKKYQRIRNAIITIQSFCRGWKVRKNKEQYEEEYKRAVGENRQNWAATKIQAWWRGITERKYLRFKNELPADRIAARKKIEFANDQMAALIRQMNEENDRTQKAMQQAVDQQEALVILYKCHHLLRTHQQEGIYSCHGTNELSLIESLMKGLPCKEYMDNVHFLYKKLVKNKRKTESGKKNIVRKSETDKNTQQRGRSDIVQDKNLHKPFILFSKIKEKPYIPSVITNKVRPEKVKTMYQLEQEKGFELTTRQDLRNRDEPYYIDFWEKEVLRKPKKENIFTCS